MLSEIVKLELKRCCSVLEPLPRSMLKPDAPFSSLFYVFFKEKITSKSNLLIMGGQDRKAIPEF